MPKPTLVEKLLLQLKNNPVIAILVVVAIGIIYVSQFTEAVGKMAALFRKPATPLPSGPNVVGHPTPGVYEFNPIYFEADSFELTGTAISILTKHAAVLRKQAELCVVVFGHSNASSEGANANQDLGLRRAYMVRSFLVKNGVAASRIATESAGAADPLKPGNSSYNARVTFKTGPAPCAATD